MALVVKNLPTNAGDASDMQVQSLGWEDPPGPESDNHASVLAWKIAWTEESGGLQAMGS